MDEQKDAATIVETPGWLEFCETLASRLGGTIVEHVVGGIHHVYWTPTGHTPDEALGMLFDTPNDEPPPIDLATNGFSIGIQNQTSRLLTLNKYKNALAGTVSVEYSAKDLAWIIAWKPPSIIQQDDAGRAYAVDQPVYTIQAEGNDGVLAIDANVLKLQEVRRESEAQRSDALRVGEPA